MKATKFKKHSLLSKNHISAVRYGGINKKVRQKGNYTVESNDSMHRAPEPKGLYCFVRGHEEHSLLVGIANGGKGHFNKKGKIGSPRKVFNIVGGYIWTHLKPHKASMIIASKDAWYKIRTEDFQAILGKDKREISIDSGKYCGAIGGLKNPYVWYTKNDLELFIGKEAIIE